jgi:hypothetical protein
LWTPRLNYCGYYQHSRRKIAFVWIAVDVINYHVRLLNNRNPWWRAARIRALAAELAAEIEGVRNPSNISDTRVDIAWSAPSHKLVAVNEIAVGILGAGLHGGCA